MRRQVWIDQPADADIPRLKRHLITDAIFDGRWLEQRADPKAYLERVRDQLGGPSGAYYCAQGEDSLGAWPTPRDMTGPQWADWVYESLQRKIAPGTSGQFPVAHLNAEVDDLQWQVSMLKRWRTKSPRRLTVWSPVCHKWEVFRAVGGTLSALGITVAPQCYVSDMARVESSNEVLGWIDIGIPANRIWPFLDGATLGHWWGEVGGAVVFTQARLP